MPHVIIEHDKEIKDKIDLSELTSLLHESVASQESVKLEFLKSRTVESENVIIGDSTSNLFLHVDLRLLSGRSKELKEKMAQDIYAILKEKTSHLACSLTVDVSELGVYIK